MNEIQSKPIGYMQRLKAAGDVLLTGKLPNPLASEPADRSRAALVLELNNWCVEERAFWKPIYDRIRQEQKFAAGKQWEGQKLTTDGKEDYIGDVVQQMVNRKTAGLYAKNPSPEACLRDRLNYEFWDGKHETIENCKALVKELAPQAMQAHEAEQAGQPVQPPPPQMVADLDKANAILQDFQRGLDEKARLQKVADTGEKLIKQQWDSQSPNILVTAKQAVTRIITSRVAFIKVMYQRDDQPLATESANGMEFGERMAALQSRLRALQEQNIPIDDARHAEAELLQQSVQKEIADLQSAASEPADEGIILDWLKATSVIIDRRCTCLKEFVGAHRVAHEQMMTVEECEAVYKVNLRDSGAKFYSKSGDAWTTEDRTDYQNDDKGEQNKKLGKQKVCVWTIEDKDTGLVHVICDGVKDFLKEPAENEPSVNRFWSIVPMVFNAQEVEENDPQEDTTIYPRSDVRLMMPMQLNINTAGEEKRKHRSANRPAWVGVKSKFASTAGQNDLERLAKPRVAHDVFMLESLEDGQKISDYIQALPKQEFDQNLYDNAQDSQAMMLATGQQPSDLGTQRPDEKATGQNIAAQSRAAIEASNIDDLNLGFSTVAQMCWEMLVQEMPQATVKKLVGRGAVWPELNRKAIAESIYLKIEAGSMGRPNQQAELQKIEVLDKPIREMFQAMGKSPEPWLKHVMKVMDANIDVDALLADAAVQAPPAPAPAEAQRPPSVSISANLKDLPPEEQDQAVKKYYGLQPAPPMSRIINKVGHGKAIDAHHQNNMPPEPPSGSGQPPQ